MPYDGSLQRVWEALDRRTPFGDYAIKTVTFTTANTDQDITHSLVPPTPEDICYIPLRSSGGGVVYQDMSSTRTAWQDGYIILRCTEAITVDLLLVIVRE